MYANDNALTKITDFKKLEITFIIQRNSGILHVLIQLLATLFLTLSHVILCIIEQSQSITC